MLLLRTTVWMHMLLKIHNFYSIWIFFFFFLQISVLLSTQWKPCRRWRDSLADVFSCHEPDATGSSGSPRQMRSHSCHVSVHAGVVVNVSRVVRTGACPLLCSALRMWGCDSVYLVILLSGFSCYKLCNLITYACFINSCHGRVAHHSCCRHLVRSSSHHAPTQGL